MASADRVLLTISNKPRAVVQTMDELTTKFSTQVKRSGRRRWLPFFLLVAGVPFFFFDLLLGYNACFFTFVTLGLWGAAVVTFITWFAARPGKPFHLHFQTARDVIHTLRDDLRPGQNILGQVDLTGARQPGKLARTATGMRNAKLNYYRDEWLNLKAKLYDGNVLRVSAIGRVKVREGMFRQGRSGKMKWKGERVENGQQIKVRIAVNPQAYEIMQNVQLSTPIGQYFVDGFSANNGILELSAASVSQTIKSEDILGVLRFAYDQLERKGQS